MTVCLRSLFRYLQFCGECGENLIRAIPTLRIYTLARVPRVMTEVQRRAFLASFDRSDATGRRDYAIALCLLELGLRVSEVVALRLDDCDWRQAVLRIRSNKSNNTRTLPLPSRVGRSIVEYLRHGRPRSSARAVFVRHSPPVGDPMHHKMVREAMCRVYAKVEGCSKWGGTHVLRHTAATQMYQKGASLKEVADILGHDCLDSTAIYTKVDLPRLGKVALPWPEVRS